MSKVHIWTAVAIAVMFSAPLFGQEEKIYSTVPAIGADWVNPKTGQIEAWADKGEVTRVGDIVKGNPDWPANKKFYVPSWWEVELYCTRASTDWDTARWRDEDDKLQYAPAGDDMHDEWPRWHCNFGEFLPPNSWKGTEVVWLAPEITDNDGVRITLFENDDPKPINPPDTGNRDDGGPGGTGSYNNQDMIWFVATPIYTEIHIINEEVETTHNPNQPNSQGLLGLWWTELDGKPNWRSACEDYVNGDVINGSADYLDLRPEPDFCHPFATGTGLKTEIFTRVYKLSWLGNPWHARLVACMNDRDNWRFVREWNGYFQLGDYDQYGQWQVIEELDDLLPPSWYPDKDPRLTLPDNHFYYNNQSVYINPDENKDMDYAYFGDAPGIANAEIFFGFSLCYLRDDHDFRTWLEMKWLGRWCLVTELPEKDEYWVKGRPMWGVTAEIDGTEPKASVRDPASAKTYPWE